MKLKTTEELEQDLFHNLLEFALTMNSYQKDYRSRCQCHSCTFGEPSPGQVIQNNLTEFLTDLPLDNLEHYYNMSCDLGLSLIWMREDQGAVLHD